MRMIDTLVICDEHMRIDKMIMLYPWGIALVAGVKYGHAFYSHEQTRRHFFMTPEQIAHVYPNEWNLPMLNYFLSMFASIEVAAEFAPGGTD